MDNKTKDAIKQLQAEMRQIQAALAAALPPAGNGETDSAEAAPPRREKLGKGDAAVEYAVQFLPPGFPEQAVKTGPISLSQTQILKTTDDAVSLLGGAFSSPQKVALLRALLLKPSESASALGQAAGLSTGSLYHHLHDLVHSGLIGQAGRNQYALTERGRRVIPVVFALAAGS